MEIEEIKGLFGDNSSCISRKNQSGSMDIQLADHTYAYIRNAADIKFYPEPPWSEAMNTQPYKFLEKAIPWNAINIMDKIIPTDYSITNTQDSGYHGQFIGFYPGLGIVKTNASFLFIMKVDVINGGVIPTRILPMLSNYWAGNVHPFDDWLIYPCVGDTYFSCHFPIRPLNIGAILPRDNYMTAGSLSLEEFDGIDNPLYGVGGQDCIVDIVFADGGLHVYEISGGKAGKKLGTIRMTNFNPMVNGYEIHLNFDQLRRYADLAKREIEIRIDPSDNLKPIVFERAAHMYLQAATG